MLRHNTFPLPKAWVGNSWPSRCCRTYHLPCWLELLRVVAQQGLDSSPWNPNLSLVISYPSIKSDNVHCSRFQFSSSERTHSCIDSKAQWRASIKKEIQRRTQFFIISQKKFGSKSQYRPEPPWINCSPATTSSGPLHCGTQWPRWEKPNRYFPKILNVC